MYASDRALANREDAWRQLRRDSKGCDHCRSVLPAGRQKPQPEPSFQPPSEFFVLAVSLSIGERGGVEAPANAGDGARAAARRRGRGPFVDAHSAESLLKPTVAAADKLYQALLDRHATFHP